MRKADQLACDLAYKRRAPRLRKSPASLALTALLVRRDYEIEEEISRRSRSRADIANQYLELEQDKMKLNARFNLADDLDRREAAIRAIEARQMWPLQIL